MVLIDEAFSRQRFKKQIHTLTHLSSGGELLSEGQKG